MKRSSNQAKQQAQPQATQVQLHDNLPMERLHTVLQKKEKKADGRCSIWIMDKPPSNEIN